MVTSLKAPLRFALMNVAHFSGRQSGFWHMLVVNTLLKVCVFIAFLLPFKALMMVVQPPRTGTIFGLSLSNYDIAIAIMVVAACGFVAQWGLRERYDTLLDAFFRSSNTATSDSCETVLALVPDTVESQLLRSTVSVSSAIIVGVFLALIALLVMPVSGVFFTVLIGAFMLALANGISENSNSRFDVNQLNEMTSFSAMLGALAFFGALIALGQNVGVFAALYVFIAARRLTASLGEIAKFVNLYKNPTVPRFLRRSAEVNVPNIFRTAPPIPVFLQSDTQKTWFEKVLSEALQTDAIVTRIEWRTLTVRSHCSFFVDGEMSGGDTFRYLINAFTKKGLRAFNQEQFFHQVCRGHALVPTLIGTYQSENEAAMVYGATSIVDTDRSYFDSRAAETLVTLWQEPPPEQLLETAHPGDFLVSIEPTSMDMLYLLAKETKEREAVEYVSQRLLDVYGMVQSAPLGLHNPDINSSTLLQDNARRGSKVSSWARVDVEPIGCLLWHLPAQSRAGLESIAEHLRTARADCRNLKVDDLLLIAATYGLAKTIQNGSYAQALTEAVSISKYLLDFRPQASAERAAE